MPYANHEGIRLYYEIDGAGPPIVLGHGMAGSVALWHETGYLQALRDDFTVVAVDARGHGGSDKPRGRDAYDYERVAGDVIAVLDAAGLDRVHYWGYSMGGYVGFALARHHPQRLLSLILGGSVPFARPASGEPTPIQALFQLGVDAGAEAVIAQLETLQGALPPAFARSLRGLDFEAMVAILWSRRPSLEAAAEGTELPCLFYAGDEDTPAHDYGRQACGDHPRRRFVSLPGRNHMTASDCAERIVPVVRDFLQQEART